MEKAFSNIGEITSGMERLKALCNLAIARKGPIEKIYSQHHKTGKKLLRKTVRRDNGKIAARILPKRRKFKNNVENMIHFNNDSLFLLFLPKILLNLFRGVCDV